MRIIGGRLKGRKLHAFRGRAVRPTPDRVREALFSILARKTEGAVVLDLFAGTGALGIEAISRGGRSAVFVDDNAASLAILKKNLKHCNLDHTTQVIRWDIAKNLNCLRSHSQEFNLVFMDPPYHRNLTAPTVKHLLKSNCLAVRATIVAEHEPGLQWDCLGSSMRITDIRSYARTQLTIFTYQTDDPMTGSA